MQPMAYHLTLDRAAVDCDVAKVSEELLRAVLTLHQLEQVGRVVDELREAPGSAL